MPDLPLFDGIAPVSASVPGGDIVLSDAVDLLNSLSPGSVACIVTDPPYGIAYHSGRHQGKNPHAPIASDWNVQIGAFLDAAERVLCKGGAVYLFTRFDVYPLWTREIPTTLSLKNQIIWDKGTHSSGDLTGNFGFRHEILMFITKGRHQLRGKRHQNIWQFPRIPSGKLRAPAEKPIELYGRAIECSSDLGDLVVDPFGGTGTLAEAAIGCGRRFLVGDIDRKMVKLARERVGLQVSADDASPRRATPVCPIFNMIPPDPALWGIHPEDFANWKEYADAK